jgi:hypothetical protein
MMAIKTPTPATAAMVIPAVTLADKPPLAFGPIGDALEAGVVLEVVPEYKVIAWGSQC